MSRFEAKVTVDFYFDVDDEDIDNLADAEDWAMNHYENYKYSAEVYDVVIDENPVYDDEDEDDTVS